MERRKRMGNIERIQAWSREAAGTLIDCGALQIAPQGEKFRFNSGLLSPMKVEIDQLRKDEYGHYKVCELLSRVIQIRLLIRPDNCVGVIRGGNSLAFDTSLILGRESAKKVAFATRFGSEESPDKMSYFKGDVVPGEKVVIVEDVTTTGTNSIRCAERVQEEGGIIVGIVSVFTYDFPQAEQNFRAHNFSFCSLVHFDSLVSIAKEVYFIDEESERMLRDWHDSAPAELDRLLQRG